MKVVINRCFGGFSLSRKAVLRARKLSGDPRWGGPTIKGDRYKDGKEVDYDYGFLVNVSREDPILVKVVEELGKQASSQAAELKVVDIPNGTRYVIEEYDGLEHIAEEHHTWT